MGKRLTSLGGKVKSKGSHKTAKRLAIKHTMLAAKAAKKNPPAGGAKKAVAKKAPAKK
jgi:hypothetical protein